MTIKQLLIILLYFKLETCLIHSKEITCAINGRKPINVVDERFISFSIDPLILLSGNNVSLTSLKMAQYLSPAFFRINGVSTSELQFTENETIFDDNDSSTNMIVTPSMWQSVDHWITKANLTPIFSIDKQKVQDEDFKSFLSKIANENRNNSFWEMSYDFRKHGSISMFEENLDMLRKLLINSFPSVQLVANFKHGNLDRHRRFMQELYNQGVVDTINWELKNSSFIVAVKEKSRLQSSTPMWLTVPESSEPGTFSSGLLWAKQVGESAKMGYKIIFAQPGYEELFADTPVYWISLLYKMLMGQNVLEVKNTHSSSTDPNTNINIYAHCHKNQDNFSRQGAMTLFVINDNPFEYSVLLRPISSHQKNLEVQTYILTSDDENSTNVYLNDVKLTLDVLENNEHSQFVPKYTRSHMNRQINLKLPKQSVGFFVFPSVRIPACINREEKIRLPSELISDFISELSTSDIVEEILTPQIPEEYKKFEYLQNGITENESQEEEDSDEKLTNRKINKKLNKNEAVAKKIELELTHDEIKRILEDRARSQTSRTDITVGSNEVNNIMREIAKNLIKKEGTTPKKFMPKKPKQMDKKKKYPNVSRLRKRLTNRHKRDINMDLLMRKIKEQPFFLNNKKIKEATIKMPGDLSEEWFNANVDKSVEKKYPAELHAKLANSEEMDLETSPDPDGSGPAKYIDERIEFLSGPSESSDEHELANYHSFHEDLKFTKVTGYKGHSNVELFEVEKTKNHERASNELPKTEVEPFVINNHKKCPGHAGYISPTFGSKKLNTMYRYKRELSNIKKDDVKKHKKFMNDKSRVMRRARGGNNKIEQNENEFKKKAVVNVENESPAVKEHQRQNKHKTNLPNLKERRKKQMQKLRNKLHERKNHTRNKRALLNFYKYEPITEKIWTPQDVFSIKRRPSYSVEIIEETVPEEVILLPNDIFQNKIKHNFDDTIKAKNKMKRNLKDWVNSEENEIEDYPATKFNKYSKVFEVAKESKSKTKDFSELKTTTDNILNQTTMPFNESASLMSTTSAIEMTKAMTMEDSSIAHQAIADVQTVTNKNFNDKEETLTTPGFIEMIVNVVNRTISNVVRLSEEFTKFSIF